MTTFTIGQVASKELFLDASTNKTWMVSGFSDVNEQEWYNLYEYATLQETGVLKPIEDSRLKTQSAFAFEDEPENMATLQDLFEYMSNAGFVKL